jgi:hypothetical protein
MIGEPLLPWQQWLVKHGLELHPDGTYRFRTVLVLVARQNGKSSIKRVLSLWRLYMDRARLVLGVAQDVSLAREQWNTAMETIRACPDLADELGPVRRVNGDEWFRLNSTGGRYKIAAANRSAGRGLSVDELTVDELREQRNWSAWAALSKTIMAREHAQIWCMSNAGDDESVVLNQLRDSALSGRDSSIGLFEWSGADGCALDDWSAIAQANPGLGYVIGPQAIISALGTDPPGVYRTEVLCQRVDALDGAINEPAWRASADALSDLSAVRDRVVSVMEISENGEHATLATAAKLDDGRVRVEISKAWRNAGEVRRLRTELVELLARIKPHAFGWYSTGPAAGLANDLRTDTYWAPVLKASPRLKALPGEPDRIVEIKGQIVSDACQGMADLVLGRTVLHPNDPLLNAHIIHAKKQLTADGWRFVRRDAGNVDAAFAAAGAVHLAMTMPPPARPRLRMLTY